MTLLKRHDSRSSVAEVALFGEMRCHKTRYYIDALRDRGVAFDVAEVDKDPSAASRLEALTGSAAKFPTFQIKGRKLRNPSLPDLDKALARAGLYDPGLVHDQKGQRFLRHMAPSDAFVSYAWRGKIMVIGHIEVDPSLRGSGRGAQLAGEVFDRLLTKEVTVRITCPFLRKVAASRPEWAKRYLKGE